MFYGKWFSGREDISPALAVRTAVFVEEQGFSADQERDAFDDRAIHAVLFSQTHIPFAAARLYIDDEGYWHIGRLCVLKEVRGQGFGDFILRMALEKAMNAGGRHFRLGAQQDKQAFYQRYGFRPLSTYLDENRPHVLMEGDFDSVYNATFLHCKGEQE